MLPGACAPDDTPPAEDGDSVADARRILAAAERAIGGSAAAVTTISTHAAVEGPTSSFETTIYSARDGSVRMEQSDRFIAGLDEAEGWQLDVERGEVSPLAPQRVAFIRGHELHMTAIAPETRLSNPAYVGEAEFAGQAAHAVSMIGEMGEPIILYYSVLDTMPLGLRITSTDPDVTTRFVDWRPYDGLRLFAGAVFEQGDEVFRYQYTHIGINDVADSVFRAPTSQEVDSR